MTSLNSILAFAGFLTIVSALSIKISKQFKIPILLIYLVLGMLLGPEGFGHIHFTNFQLAKNLGTISLCYILFAGSLETKVTTMLDIIPKGVLLSSLGIVLTAGMTGVIVKYLTSFTWNESFLLGSIVSSTDAAAVIAILGFSNVRIPLKLTNLLKLESGSNDPVAYLLVILFSSLLSSDATEASSLSMMLTSIFIEISLGFMLGIFFGKMGLWTLKNLSLGIFEFDHILIFGLVMLTYSITNMVHGNGFLSIYIFGLFLGKERFKFKNNTIRFYSTISWFMQIGMFIILGLLVSPLKLMHLWKTSVLISLALIFIVRPLVILICLKGKSFNFFDKLFVSWGGLKGAVPIVFAMYPLALGIPHANNIFHMVFFVVILSILIQGSTLDLIAKTFQFNFSSEEDHEIDTELDLEKIEGLENSLVEIQVIHNSMFQDRHIQDLNLPMNTLIIAIKRNNNYFNPSGDTVILEHDFLFILTPQRKKFINDYLKVKYESRNHLSLDVHED